MKHFLRIGKIISLHGIKGEAKVFPTTDDIKRFDDLDVFYIIDSDDADDIDFEDANTYKKQSVKYLKNTVVIKIEGYESIEESSKLINKNIYVSRDNAIPLFDNEYYIVDLIGLKVYAGNIEIGIVKEILRNKSHDILSVLHNDKEILIPFVDEYIESIDINLKVVRVKNIEGLI